MLKPIGTGVRITIIAIAMIGATAAFQPAYAVRPADPNLLHLEHAVDVADQNLADAQWTLMDAESTYDQAENAFNSCNSSDSCVDQDQAFYDATEAYNQAWDNEFQAEIDDEDAQERLREYEENFGS